MMIFRAPVFIATLALLVVGYAAFGIPGVVWIVLVSWLLRHL